MSTFGKKAVVASIKEAGKRVKRKKKVIKKYDFLPLTLLKGIYKPKIVC